MGVEIGDLVGPVGVVDAKGTISLDDRPIRVEWAIGAEDRWHVATDEVAVRQELLDSTPVPVTSMRVPGGDIVMRVAGVRDGNERAVLIEVENNTATAVALALAVRPTGPGAIGRAEVVGDEIVADGRAVVALSRGPGGTVAVDDEALWPSVVAGPGGGDRGFESRAGSAAAAMIVPLAHGTTTRARVAIEGTLAKKVDVATVASGWRVMAERAASVDIGVGRVVDDWRRGVTALVLAAGTTDFPTAATVAPLLDLVGLPDEADRTRAPLIAAVDDGRLRGRIAADTAVALASRRLRSGRPSGLVELAALLVGAAGEPLAPQELGTVAAALDLEDERIAHDIRQLARGPAAVWTGGTSWAMHRLLARLVDDLGEDLDLLPEPADDWAGQPIDVRGLATRHGGLSYSVRWHGDRPALLWELTAGRDTLIRCSGLDATWSTTRPAGEALLRVRAPESRLRCR